MKRIALKCDKKLYFNNLGIIGWIILGAVPNLEGLLSGRFLVGLSMGMEGSIHSMYVCELTSKKWRGPLAGSGVILITLGILAIYVMGSFVSWQVIIQQMCVPEILAFTK
jgi:MFS family permease